MVFLPLRHLLALVFLCSGVRVLISRMNNKPQFHFLTITLERARLGTSELRWWVIASWVLIPAIQDPLL